jgi:hypothetical protein
MVPWARAALAKASTTRVGAAMRIARVIVEWLTLHCGCTRGVVGAVELRWDNAFQDPSASPSTELHFISLTGLPNWWICRLRVRLDGISHEVGIVARF